VDVDGLEPLMFISESSNQFREDHVEASLEVEQVLKNAPMQYESYFKVPTSGGGK
jgi:aspartyl/glutamyl-tRNA(Asn/Gln) amidotransferase C subunit